MANEKRTVLNLSIKAENLTKLDDIKKLLKQQNTAKPYQGRLSNAVILNSLIELLYDNRHFLELINSNDEVKGSIKRALLNLKNNLDKSTDLSKQN